MSAFSNSLRYHREQSGLLAKQLAAEIGVPYSTYSNYEQGKSEPKLDTLIKIATILKVSIDDLVCYEVPPPTVTDGLESFAEQLNKIGCKAKLIDDRTIEVEYTIFYTDTNTTRKNTLQFEFIMLGGCLREAWRMSEANVMHVRQFALSNAISELGKELIVDRQNAIKKYTRLLKKKNKFYDGYLKEIEKNEKEIEDFKKLFKIDLDYVNRIITPAKFSWKDFTDKCIAVYENNKDKEKAPAGEPAADKG